jgi:hypothetical protein
MVHHKAISAETVNTDKLKANSIYDFNGSTGTSNQYLSIDINENIIWSNVNAGLTGNEGDVPVEDGSGGLKSNSVIHVDTANNRVGINVANPTEDLEIDGNIQIDTSGLGRLIFYDGNDDHEHAEIDGDDDGTTGGKLLFKTKVDGGSVSTKMIIGQNGNVGIGTTIPSDKMEVNGTINATRYKVSGIPGFTGTGTYTTFKILNGIITNAS